MYDYNKGYLESNSKNSFKKYSTFNYDLENLAY